MSGGRRDRSGAGRRVDLRSGGLLRRKRRPASRQGGLLRRDGRTEAPDGEHEDASPRERDEPEVSLRRGVDRGSPPVAKVTTLVLLLLLVLALIFLL